MTQSNTILSFSGGQAGCHNCLLHDHCRSVANNSHDRQAFNKITIRQHKYERGDHLFLAKLPFSSLFVIRSGSVKTCSYAQDGEERVTGYHLTGKMLGLDAIATGYYNQTAISLETSSICEIPLSRLKHSREDVLELQDVLLQAMSNEIHDDQTQLALLARMPAASRLAGFLLKLSWQFRQRGYSGGNFHLSLSRHDIASLLGLAVETVSRLFTQFQDAGILSVDRKHIILNDMERLIKLSPGHMELAQLPRADVHSKAGQLYNE